MTSNTRSDLHHERQEFPNSRVSGTRDWIVPPDPARRGRRLGDKSNNKGARLLLPLLDQFCTYQLRQRGKAPGGVEAYRWTLQQFVAFLLAHQRRPPRVTDLTPTSIQAWMDDMATAGLALSTLRVRQAAVSSFCRWLVRRQLLSANPVTALERPPHKQIGRASCRERV